MLVFLLGVLRLNEKMLAQSSVQHLALQPKQAYLNVVENEGRTLEKRRDLICGLIIQILKEKAMHIDRLVFRVWDARSLSLQCSSAGSHKGG